MLEGVLYQHCQGLVTSMTMLMHDVELAWFQGIVAHIHRLMDNARVLFLKKQEAQLNLTQAVRHLQEVNIEFRTMDKDINTVRPLLMKLQRNKDEYTR